MSNAFTTAKDVAFDSNGGFVVAGDTLSHNGGEGLMGFARYTSSGTLDKSFSGDGKLTVNFGYIQDQSATGVGFDSNGKIVAVGQASYLHDNDDGAKLLVLRLTSAGGVERSSMTTFPNTVVGVRGVPEWRIAISGTSLFAAGHVTSRNHSNFAIAKIRGSDLKADTSFSGDGLALTPIYGGHAIGRAIVLDSNNKPIVAGYAY